MKLGTIVYEQEIYNLDYMTAEEVQKILTKVDDNKQENITQMQNLEIG